MTKPKLSDRGMEAARRIAEKSNVPVDKVIAAFAKAALRKSPVNAVSLFLPR